MFVQNHDSANETTVDIMVALPVSWLIAVIAGIYVVEVYKMIADLLQARRDKKLADAEARADAAEARAETERARADVAEAALAELTRQKENGDQ